MAAFGIVLFTAGCQAWTQRQPAPAPRVEATPVLVTTPVPAAPAAAEAPTPTATETPTSVPTRRPSPTFTPTPLPLPAADDIAGIRWALLKLHNQVRTGYGLPTYTISPALEQVAQKQAEHLAGMPLDALTTLGDAAHLGPDGTPAATRMQATGYPLGASAENWGLFARWQDAFVSWLNDEQQRQAIISPEYREVGIGIARHAASGNYVFVVDFAAPR